MCNSYSFLISKCSANLFYFLNERYYFCGILVFAAQYLWLECGVVSDLALYMQSRGS